MNYENKDKIIIDEAVEDEYNTTVVTTPGTIARDDVMTDDAKTGAAIGGVGSAVTGAIAGSVLGPAGAAIGAVAGGIVGAVASGAAVQAVDSVDNDGSINEGLHVDDDQAETVHRGVNPAVVPGAARPITDAEIVSDPLVNTGEPTILVDTVTGEKRIINDPHTISPEHPGDTITTGRIDDRTGRRLDE